MSGGRSQRRVDPFGWGPSRRSAAMTGPLDGAAVVTGAAGGIGRAICRRLGAAGATIVAVDLADQSAGPWRTWNGSVTGGGRAGGPGLGGGA